MIESPWIAIAIVWIMTLAVGGGLWQRFTRVPVQSAGLTSRSSSSRVPATMRRVVPLWLALVLLVLLITAVWLTVRWATSG
jgi:hypothetical protein